MDTQPNPKNTKSKKSVDWWGWGCVTAVLITIAIFTAPMVLRAQKTSDQSEALSNLRHIGLALFEFETEYGEYPNEATAAKVAKKTKTDLDLSGTSSNALFRQLFAVEVTQSEQIFYAKIEGSHKPDGDISEGNTLAPGELAFGYITGLSTKGNPSRVLAFCPIIPGTDRFDPKPFEGRAIILRMDNSVTSLKINEDGYAMLGDGKTLFETGDETIWGDHQPDIRYPDLPPLPKPSFIKRIFSR